MTNDAIKEIKKAEDNGAQLIINAQAESKYRVEQASAEIQDSLASEELKLDKQLKEKVSVAEAEAEKIISDKAKVTEKESATIEEKAMSKMDEATKVILEVIKESWQ